MFHLAPQPPPPPSPPPPPHPPAAPSPPKGGEKGGGGGSAPRAPTRGAARASRDRLRSSQRPDLHDQCAEHQHDDSERDQQPFSPIRQLVERRLSSDERGF